MPTFDRRRFLQIAGGGATVSVLPESIARAASIPANRRTGSIEDVEHIVVLMQENRSFDHYFGTMRGVRGFADPHPAVLPNGRTVWHQSDGTRDILPFRPDLDDLGLVFLRDLDHGWDGGHEAFNRGQYDAWVPTKTSTTMAHLERRDIPFHYALADAFTLCDDYHCSLLGPTDPNRYYMWTGWVGNDGQGGGPVIGNDELGYNWKTYPERLQQAGITWRIYQDEGMGLDAAGVWGYTEDAYIGNYGDNSLLYFDNYRNAAPGNPLYDRARTGTRITRGGTFFDQLRADVQADKLPQISWICAPEAFTEHPNWPANYGAWYVARMLDALTSNPEVWSKTAFFLTYDENDGFFDHVVPAYANTPDLPGASTVETTYENYTGPAGVPGPYGIGQRVPMTVISPWSTGGWVCSETFDHTSIIRFMEARFGVHEPQITPWRRAVCGDLTSAFDFDRIRGSVPRLPSTDAYAPPDDQRHPDYVPVPPADPTLPAQERGFRPSRALGYDLAVRSTVRRGHLGLELRNSGRLGAHLQARAAEGPVGGPFSYTVGAGHTLSPSWVVADRYDVSLHGPAGFFRRYAGSAAHSGLEATLEHDRRHAVLVLENAGPSPVTVKVADAYGHHSREVRLGRRAERRVRLDGHSTGGWYDVTVTGPNGFVRQAAGRVETGRDSISDPQMGY